MKGSQQYAPAVIEIRQQLARKPISSDRLGEPEAIAQLIEASQAEYDVDRQAALGEADLVPEELSERRKVVAQQEVIKEDGQCITIAKRLNIDLIGREHPVEPSAPDARGHESSR